MMHLQFFPKDDIQNATPTFTVMILFHLFIDVLCDTPHKSTILEILCISIFMIV